MSSSTWVHAETPWARWMAQACAASAVGLSLTLLPGATVRGLATLFGAGCIALGLHGLTLAASRSRVTSRVWALIISAAALSVGFAVLRDPKGSALVVLWVVVFFLGVCTLMLGALWLIRAALGGGWSSGALGMLGVVSGVVFLVSTVITAEWMPRLGGLVLLIGGLGLAGRAWRARQEATC